MKNFIVKKYLNNKLDFCFLLFSLGLFLIPSAFFISAILLLITGLINTFKLKKDFFKDKWNILFFVGALFMLLSASVQTLNHQNLSIQNMDVSLSWIGLANWLPFFWCFWAFQPCLNSPEKRKICCFLLLSGSIPVIASGLGQVFFNWHGPLQTFFNLIIWYQRPIDKVTGLTGLFNNANYAGCWLNVIWPFSLAFIIYRRGKFLENISIYIFAFTISFSIVLTNSRSAWLGILVGSIMVFGEKSFIFIRNLTLLFFITIATTIFPIFGNNIQNIARKIIPESIWIEFSDFQYSRLQIWLQGIQTTFDRPIFGSGAGSFSEIFQLRTGLWKGHAHNLPLELIISYGIPVGILIFLPIFYLTYLSITYNLTKKERKRSSIFDQAWTSALFVLIISQMVDVQYFDGRISIILWILLAGAKNIIEEKESIIKHDVCF